MTKRIAWVMDSTGYLDDDLQKNDDIYIVPMVVIMEGKEYRDGIDIIPKELYRLMEEEKVAVTTSQPSVGTFIELYQSLEERYDCIISVHLSGSLSGTVDSSRQAAAMVSIPVYVYDTLVISYPMTMVLKKIMSYTERGMEITDALQEAEKYSKSNETYVLIGSLEQLHRSGRLSGTQYLLGSMLNFKPIISIENGILATIAKVRSEKKAEERIFDLFKKAYTSKEVKECCLLFGASLTQTDKWRKVINEIDSSIIIHAYPIGSSVGVHAGPKTLGLSWFNEE
ncbi:DegV family protein [Bacillus cihuensis]|uniref:DegV family protein n=1 Tax=Bacillus cihuensis TaxID=1208599 RepID=UPI00042778A6|nr:DegV family protein [Bacillus cihuensis]